MEKKMFCFQCEQTRNCTGCTGAAGACGKLAGTAKLQDELTSLDTYMNQRATKMMEYATEHEQLQNGGNNNA